MGEGLLPAAVPTHGSARRWRSRIRGRACDEALVAFEAPSAPPNQLPLTLRSAQRADHLDELVPLISVPASEADELPRLAQHESLLAVPATRTPSPRRNSSGPSSRSSRTARRTVFVSTSITAARFFAELADRRVWHRLPRWERRICAATCSCSAVGSSGNYGDCSADAPHSGTHQFACILALEPQRLRDTENRGVLGSIPSLAIAKDSP